MEARSLLPLLVRPADHGTVVALAPALGLVDGLVPVGSLLVPGAVAGYLRVLSRRYALVVPDGVRGHLAHPRPHDRIEPVSYGEALFDLVPAEAASDVSSAEVAADPEAKAAVAGAGQAEGLTPVRANTVGTFYRRPSPEAPPYVQVGDEISPGTVVGLVEVMKVFNQITYDGSSPATVRQVPLEDGADVKAGQALVLVEPKG